MPVRVLLVDPQPFFCEALAAALEEDERLEVVGWTADAREAAQLVSSLAPDVVLCELACAVTPPAGLLHRRDDHAKLVVITRGHEGDALLPVADAGATGCIGHTTGVSDLSRLLTEAATGRFVVDPNRLGEALRRAASGTAVDQEHAAVLAGLSPREREILDLLTEGLDNRAIAGRLHLSSHTVRTHVANILRKLGVGSRAEAARVALRLGAGAASVSILRIEGPVLEET